jgi:topoisomerase IV subunit A
LATHFDEDMIVLEKWNPKKPISAIYYDGEKERYYIKRFLVETENKGRKPSSTDHAKSQIGNCFNRLSDPMVELIFTKVKGVQKENQIG